jgi:hypothetical protein
MHGETVKFMKQFFFIIWLEHESFKYYRSLPISHGLL